MKVKRNENVIEYSGQTANLEEIIDTLASKDSKQVANFLVEHASLPRELRTNALRYVLNDYVKIAKELVLSDEFTYRLNWYDKFSEYQLINFWNVLKTSNFDKFNEGLEASRFKKTFYLLLLLNSEAVDFSDDELAMLLELKTLSGDDESFTEFMTELDPVFYDYDYNFDGMSYEDFKTNLKRSSTVADIRNLAAKYDIQVPKRLKKEELVNLVAEGLRRQGKYDDETLPTLKKMSAISLQRFAKVNHIKASTEMKKEDIVDYIMNRIESSPKAIHKQRIELVSIPELEEFKFSRDYLREVKIVEEFDDDLEANESVNEPTPEKEEVPVPEVNEPEPVVEPEEPEPTLESEPVVEPTLLDDEKNLDELVSQLDMHIEEEPEKEEPIATPEPVAPVKEEVEPTKDYNKELDELENRPESVYSDELLQTIVRILEERDSKDVVTELLDDNRFNSVIKMYEERISYLEKTINDMRTTPVPINIQVSYPEFTPMPVKQAVCEEPEKEEVKEPIGDEKTQILPEEQNEVLEKAPEAVVTEENNLDENAVEEQKEESALELTPIVLDSTFDSLTNEEKNQIAKDSMHDAKTIDTTGLPDEKKSKRLKKLEKKADKLEKIRSANERALYKRRRSRKVRKFILTIILIVLILAIALTTILLLIDNGTIKGAFAEQFDTIVSNVPFLKKEAAFRTTILKWYQTAYDWIKNLIAGIKK